MKKLILLSVLSFTTVLFAQSDKSMLQIKGSDTMVNTVQVLAEKYMAKNPGKTIAVTGGGSGTGIAALLNRTCNIANSSREIKDKERLAAKDKVNEIVIAIDGLSIIVSKKNKINQLTIDQLGQIYRGEVTNWKELGGSNTAISLYGRQPNSGTYDFFREFVVKADYSKQVKEMNGNAQIVEAVKNSNNATGIGYVGAGYVKTAKDVKVLKIAKSSGAKAYSAEYKYVENGEYPISRPLYQYVAGELTNDEKQFLAYELGAEGQKIIQDQGFFPITKKQKKTNDVVLGVKEVKKNRTK